jgi:predicted transcriptional regulator
MPTDFVIQTAVSDELSGALKAHAALRNKLLYDVFIEAIEEFFQHRQMLQKRRQSVPYLISPKGARYFNVRIPEKLAQRVQSLADEDNVPARRFVYAALVHYAASHKLISSIGTIVSGVVDLEAPEIAQTRRTAKKRP